MPEPALHALDELRWRDHHLQLHPDQLSTTAFGTTNYTYNSADQLTPTAVSGAGTTSYTNDDNGDLARARSLRHVHLPKRRVVTQGHHQTS